MAANNITSSTGGHLSDLDFGITAQQTAEEGNNENRNNDYGLTTPIAPEGGRPVFPGNMAGGDNSGNDNDYGLTTPIAPEGGRPVFPGPSVQSSAWFPWYPIFPSCPSCNVQQRFAQVRFLNASTSGLAVNITVDNTSYASNFRFGTITDYAQIADGFHTISVRRATGLRSLLIQQTFPFSAGQKYTMVLVDTASGGLNLVQVTDTGCSNMAFNTGCYRVANMAFSGSSFDVMLMNTHDAVFRNVGFQEVTAYKQAMAGSYQFYVTNSSNFTIMRELPIIVIGAVTGSGFANEPLISYQADIVAGRNYTTYLIGNSWSGMNFAALTVED